MSQRKLATPLGGSVALSVAIAAAYLAWAPPSTDLAAQVFRADLFSDHGLIVWSDSWYGGFHVPGYSLLYPPLAALAGVRVAGALAAVAAAALFAQLARGRFGDRALIGSLWFAAGVGAWLFTGRLTFLLGVAIGLGALLAADSRRLALAAALAVLTAFASPVAGLFLALAGVTAALAGLRHEGAALALPAAAAVAILGLGFPTHGEAPFTASAFVAVPLFVAGALILLPREERAMRLGVALYGLLVLVAFAVPNPLGGNAVRLGALFAGPLAVLALRTRPAILVAVAVPLLYWQLSAPVRDLASGLGDPSAKAAYYDPLLDELDRRGALGSGAPTRIHVPPTRNRWEAVHVAERVPLARGWLRQLESDDFELFEDGSLTAEAYAGWLAEHGVSYVAVSAAEPDYLARDELSLIADGLPYLGLVWEGEGWRLYRVLGGPRLVTGGAGPSPALRRLGPASFRLEAGPGEYLVRLRWTSYWQLEGADACASDDGGWTRIDLRQPGRVELAARFSLAALAGRQRVCSR